MSPSTPQRFSWTRETIIYLATLLLLAWPLLINEAPFYSADSASYLRGGRIGFDTGIAVLGHWLHAPGVFHPVGAGGELHAIATKAIGEAGGTRSISYSLVTYFLRVPGDTLIALTVVQCAAVSFVVCCLRRLIVPQSSIGQGIGIGAAVAALTSAPWYASYAVPDIWAGILIGAALILTVLYDRTTFVLRLILVALISFSITVHGSHIPIALFVILAGAIANLRMRRGAPRFGPAKAIWFVSPFVLGIVALLGTSYAAFGELSLAPKRYPIQLARSVADGPGAWYLHDHCATEHYAICEIFGSDPPRNVGDFLWGKNGVRNRATPEQMDRIRAEESLIVRRAALAYPMEQLRHSVTNACLQFFDFGVRKLTFGEKMISGDDPTVVQVDADRPMLKKVSTWLIYLSAAASVLLLVASRRRLSRVEISALWVLVVGLAVNAAVCGILSAVTDRYQGRVAWILPALTFILLLKLRLGSSAITTNAKATLA